MSARTIFLFTDARGKEWVTLTLPQPPCPEDFGGSDVEWATWLEASQVYLGRVTDEIWDSDGDLELHYGPGDLNWYLSKLGDA